MIKRKPNSGGLPYADRNEARHLLLDRALRTAEARVAVLREIAHADSGKEEIRTQNRGTELSGARRSGAGRRSVRTNSMGRAQRERTGETRL
jgi:hypothetical protein